MYARIHMGCQVQGQARSAHRFCSYQRGHADLKTVEIPHFQSDFF